MGVEHDDAVVGEFVRRRSDREGCSERFEITFAFWNDGRRERGT